MCVDPTNINLMIQKGSGLFEASHKNQLILTGQISILKDLNVQPEIPTASENETTEKCIQGMTSKNELYTIFKNNRYELGNNYKNIKDFKMFENEICGHIEWQNDWIYFLEGLLKLSVLENIARCCIHTPVSVRQIVIHPEIFEEHLEKGTCVLKLFLS